ncbi:MAG: sugar phosphate isomerase/epimerase family protein, partial [Planctomycetota bacterium]
ANKIELVCLGSSATLPARKQADLAKQKAQLSELIELAGKLGCPFVRILAGEAPGLDNSRAALSRLAEQLITLAPEAARNNVTLLVENGGDFPDSTSLWFLVDAVSHPSVRCCWNQFIGRTVPERATNSLPRLGYRMGLVHLCDAKFDERNLITSYVSLGQGDLEIARQVEILRGLAYEGYLMFEWPKLWMDALPGPEQVLPGAVKILREKLAEKQPVLSAYKGDKNAPRFRSRPVTSST